MLQISKVRSVLLFVLILFAYCGVAQNSIWVEIKDKDLSGQTDWLSAPVNQKYLAELTSLGVEIDYVSSWLNAVNCIASPKQIEAIQELTFVKGVVAEKSLVTTQSGDFEVAQYGNIIEHLNPAGFEDAGLTGRGVKVGIIDAGFSNIDSMAMFEHVFERKQIQNFKDFIDPGREDRFKAMTNGDSHGRKVMGFVGGYTSEKKKAQGLAYNALFYLARTEHGDLEHRVEESDWIKAIEWMDEQGVKLVNTSLGYSTFDDPEENYEIKDMNGKTAMITKAAQLAVDERGMLLVVSAGNQGNKKDWRVITAPGDAKGVLTVGATRDAALTKIGYSSIGVDFTEFVKPDVSVFSPNGTSFSAPAVTGFAACLMEEYPEKSNVEIRDAIEKSGHLYPYKNNYLGYGVPDAQVALDILAGNWEKNENASELKAESDKIDITVVGDVGHVVLFHKYDKVHVMRQALLGTHIIKRKNRSKTERSFVRNKKGTKYLRLKRPENAKFTSVQLGDRVIEVIWP